MDRFTPERMTVADEWEEFNRNALDGEGSEDTKAAFFAGALGMLYLVTKSIERHKGPSKNDMLALAAELALHAAKYGE